MKKLIAVFLLAAVVFGSVGATFAHAQESTLQNTAEVLDHEPNDHDLELWRLILWAYTLRYQVRHPHLEHVAFYQTGVHGIVGHNEEHRGWDVVFMLRNPDENDPHRWDGIQYFYGGEKQEDGTWVREGVRSWWKNVGDDMSCEEGWYWVENAQASWGDYWEPGANYCVNNREFELDPGFHWVE